MTDYPVNQSMSAPFEELQVSNVFSALHSQYNFLTDTLEAMTSVDELRLEGASVKEMAGLVSYAPFSRLLVIANFHGPHLIVASLSEDLNSFVSVTVFDVTMPVYSMDITESEAGDGTQDIQVCSLPFFLHLVTSSLAPLNYWCVQSLVCCG